MTLPASGSISISQINVELGQSATYAGSLSWIQSNAKSGQNTYDLNNYHGKAYYQRNQDGNCNNGNCAVTDCNCGVFNCANCVNCNAVNCANCDTRAWLQNNCNCACTYNCTQVTHSYDCNCNCKNCWSDDRLKFNRAPIKNALSKLRSIDGFYHQYTDIAKQKYNQNNKLQIGVSAQQVKSVFPELVTEGEHLSVDYVRLTPVLLEAIKELSNTVDILKSKIESLEK